MPGFAAKAEGAAPITCPAAEPAAAPPNAPALAAAVPVIALPVLESVPVAASDIAGVIVIVPPEPLPAAPAPAPAPAPYIEAIVPAI